jgi:hypothetical protein
MRKARLNIPLVSATHAATPRSKREPLADRKKPPQLASFLAANQATPRGLKRMEKQTVVEIFNECVTELIPNLTVPKLVGRFNAKLRERGSVETMSIMYGSGPIMYLLIGDTRYEINIHEWLCGR